MAGHNEVANDWRKSSKSGDGSCVEIRMGPDHVDVRDTKNRNGAILRFSHAEWRAFLGGVRLGEFELPE